MQNNFERLHSYKKYLNSIQGLLDNYFENQSDYICCKKGCAYCCEKGVYPYSELEIQYLIFGVMSLSEDYKIKIYQRIENLKKEYQNFQGDKFLHRCPFLDDDKSCMVYDYRGIICRNFGILQVNDAGKVLMPFCQEMGLNYSTVYDDDERKFNFDKVVELGYKHAPTPFPVSRNLLMDKDLFEGEPLDFGESKAMIEWF